MILAVRNARGHYAGAVVCNDFDTFSAFTPREEQKKTRDVKHVCRVKAAKVPQITQAASTATNQVRTWQMAWRHPEVVKLPPSHSLSLSLFLFMRYGKVSSRLLTLVFQSWFSVTCSLGKRDPDKQVLSKRSEVRVSSSMTCSWSHVWMVSNLRVDILNGS